MHLKIRNLGRYILLILLVVILILNSEVLAITVDTSTSFVVENETYKFYRIMNFHTITIANSYIIFNTTGFCISSSNSILVTLVYLHKDIPRAGDGKKVLEFYAKTISGTVIFSLSGFPAGNKYAVKRGGISIATPTVNSSGYISFSNKVWNSTLFEIFQVGEGVINTPPVVSNIPDQTISAGESFSQILLDNYVTDAEDYKRDIIWSYTGNVDLTVSIVNRVATISIPSPLWSGSETIRFTATDKGGLTDSDAAKFTITANNIPPPAPPPSTDDPPPSSPPPSSPPDDPPTSDPPINDTNPDNTGGVIEENNPPLTPINVTGPYFVGMGVEYCYIVSTTDSEGDGIRYKVDWGNGTISDWSAFVDSGAPVIFSHIWSSAEKHQLFVIAQDIQGLNTSWNYIFDITVSDITNNSDPQMRDFVLSDNLVVNQSIVFNATGIFDVDGIESHFWSFGDGTNGTGIITTHTYIKPDTYTVVLIVTDEKGNTYSKSSIVTVSSNPLKNEQVAQENLGGPDILLISAGIIAIFAAVVFFILIAFFKKSIKSFMEHHVIVWFPRVKVFYSKYIHKNLVVIKQKLKTMSKLLTRLHPKVFFKRINRFFKNINHSKPLAKVYYNTKKKHQNRRRFTKPEYESLEPDKKHTIGAVYTFFKNKLEKPLTHTKKVEWLTFEDILGMPYEINQPIVMKKNAGIPGAFYSDIDSIGSAEATIEELQMQIDKIREIIDNLDI